MFGYEMCVCMRSWPQQLSEKSEKKTRMCGSIEQRYPTTTQATSQTHAHRTYMNIVSMIKVLIAIIIPTFPFSVR